jgi:putative ABC transport system permease protein
LDGCGRAAQGERAAFDVGSDPGAFAERLRRIAVAVDEQAIVREPLPLDENAERSEPRLATFWLGILVAMIALVAVVLLAAGLFALMSFTVSERTREIGIRSALGAQPGSIVRTIATRALAQITLGVVAGVVLHAVLDTQVELSRNPSVQRTSPSLLLTATAGAILVVGLLSCLPPLLRGLRIRPVEALREG